MRGNQTWAHAPCIPPHCLIQCASKPSPTISCDPGPPIRPSTLTCNHEGVNQTFHNIIFGIPEQNIVACVPEKVFDFATIVPGSMETYIYDEKDEGEYARNYRASFYAYTWRKSGWDCLRHYEILASGTLPFFSDLARAPSTVLSLLPKDLILQGMSLPGVPRTIGKELDHQQFPRDEYYAIACKALEYTRRHLTTKAVAQYVLDTLGKPHARKVLLLSDKNIADYMREMFTHGIREILGAGAVDVPAFDFMYDYPADTPPNKLDRKELYGQGFSYSHRLPQLDIDRENIEERIRQHEFDVIIYASTEGRPPYVDTVLKYYDASSIAVINGEDWQDWDVFREENNTNQLLFGKATFFWRELPPTCRTSVSHRTKSGKEFLN